MSLDSLLDILDLKRPECLKVTRDTLEVLRIEQDQAGRHVHAERLHDALEIVELTIEGVYDASDL